MTKKLAGLISIAEMVIAVIMYFAIAYHFDNDPRMMQILSHKDFEATLLRLLIYIVPGINIICSLFGIVFSVKGLLLFTGLLEVGSGLLTLYFRGRSDFIYIMAIIIIVLGALYFFLILFTRFSKKENN